MTYDVPFLFWQKRERSHLCICFNSEIMTLFRSEMKGKREASVCIQLYSTKYWQRTNYLQIIWNPDLQERNTFEGANICCEFWLHSYGLTHYILIDKSTYYILTDKLWLLHGTLDCVICEMLVIWKKKILNEPKQRK